MNKDIFFGVAVGVLIAALGGWAFILLRSSSTLGPIAEPITIATSTSATTTSTTSPTSVATLPRARATPTIPSTKVINPLHTLLSHPGNFQCDYTQSDRASKSINVVYIADGKMRGEFRTLAGENSQANLVVYDGSYLYAWAEGARTGTKTVFRSLSQLPVIIPQDLTSGAAYGTGINAVGWKCHAWSKDKALLSAPAYVTFTWRE